MSLLSKVLPHKPRRRDANNALRNPTQENVLKFVSNLILFTAKTNPLLGIGIGILDATGVSDNIIRD